jgi:ankyrin repeat protein
MLHAMESLEALQRAARFASEGDVGALESTLRDEPDVLRARDGEGHTLLGLACKAATGDIGRPFDPGTPAQHAAVDLILRAGADPSAAADDGWAPLHTAAMAGHVDLARRLLAAGASRAGALYGCRGGSPLSLALFYGEAKVAAILAPPCIPDNLRTAAALGQSVGRFLDGERLTPQAVDGLDFYRPLPAFPEWARSYDRKEVLDEALSWAARNDRCEAMGELVALGAEVNANAYRGTPLLWAVCMNRVEAATWLLDHGADPDLRHDFGGASHGKGAVAMHLAAQYGCIECLQLLLDRGADAGIEDAAYHATPLGWAEHAGAAGAAAVLRAARPGR